MTTQTPSHGFTLFDTAIGACGVAWGPNGILAVELPAASEAATRERLRARCPDAPEGGGAGAPPAVASVIDRIVRLLAGEAVDFDDARLDYRGVPPFHQRVCEAARKIGSGATCTYGELAEQLGSPGAARAVGQALGKNRFPIVVPCHRVLGAGDKMGGFSATGGVETKRRILAIEGANVGRSRSLFD